MDGKERKNPALVLNRPQQLCEACVQHIFDTIRKKKPIHYHWCEHSKILAVLKLTPTRIDWTLYNPIEAAEVLELFKDAQRVFELDSAYESGLRAWRKELN